MTKEVLEEFFDIFIFLPIFKFPSFRNYWQNSTRFPQIANVMPRNKF